MIDHIQGLNEGFAASQAPEHTQVLHLLGLNCGRCVNKVETSLKEESDCDVKVNLAQGKAFCLHLGNFSSVQDIVESIGKLGFKACPLKPHQGRVLLNVSISNARS